MAADELQHTTSVFKWNDGLMWSVVVLFMLGSLARMLVSNEPFCWRRFWGEMILSFIGAVLMYSFGLLQGMSPIQIVFFGSLGSLGGIRLIEWVIKIARRVREVT